MTTRDSEATCGGTRNQRLFCLTDNPNIINIYIRSCIGILQTGMPGRIYTRVHTIESSFFFSCFQYFFDRIKFKTCKTFLGACD